MNYELIEKIYKDGTFKSQIPVTKANKKYLTLPPLSELIKACGDDFVALVRWNYKDIHYVASNCERDTPMIEHGLDIHGQGETPEEAVANLYLKVTVSEAEKLLNQ